MLGLPYTRGGASGLPMGFGQVGYSSYDEVPTELLWSISEVTVFTSSHDPRLRWRQLIKSGSIILLALVVVLVLALVFAHNVSHFRSLLLREIHCYR